MTTVNPWFLAYSNLTGMLEVAKPGAIIVTGRGNRYDPAFQEARKRGAKVYSYWNVTEAPDNLNNPEDAAMYLVAGNPPPRWPLKTAAGADRAQWPGNHLLDLRPGSGWLKHIVPLSGKVAASGKFDGFFLDTLGARTWSSLAAWESWPVAEQVAWARGCANLASEIAAVVPASFELVHNNLWALPKTHTAFDQNAIGEKACNGVCIENASGNVPSEYHKNYAAHIFGRGPRRVLVIDSTDADTILWSKVSGVTHVCSVEKTVGETYAKVTPPVVPYTGWEGNVPIDWEQRAIALALQVKVLAAQNAALDRDVLDLTNENTILVSKLTLARNGLAKLAGDIS